ncbi:MAG: dTMP kinase [Rickettsiales bacterium]|nr:dTMP kinase [Rickettsiales bacterium]
MKGKFITFEGGEGSGKSSVSRYVYEKLRSKKQNVILTREPGGTFNAEKIRAILVNSSDEKLEPISELLLHYAARAEHFNQFILPHLKKNYIVLCDRFYDSTTAYQGYGHKIDLKIINQVRKIVLGNFKPNLTFIMNIKAEDGLKRATSRLSAQASTESRYENMNIAFHKRLEKGFLEIAKKEPKRCLLIDASRKLEVVCDEVIKIIENKI